MPRRRLTCAGTDAALSSVRSCRRGARLSASVGRNRKTDVAAKHEGILTTQQWPSWWAWELELTAHLLKRMEDRGFNEVDLRHMLEYASGHTPDIVEGRFVIGVRHDGRGWAAIVEPDLESHLLVVVTAYPVD